MQEAFEDNKNRLTALSVLAYSDFETTFIVALDASSVAFGFILAQKEEYGKVHLVQLASRTIVEQECCYSISKREALAVVFALKKRLHLLSDKPFSFTQTIKRYRPLLKRRTFRED